MVVVEGDAHLTVGINSPNWCRRLLYEKHSDDAQRSLDLSPCCVQVTDVTRYKVERIFTIKTCSSDFTPSMANGKTSVK